MIHYLKHSKTQTIALILILLLLVNIFGSINIYALEEPKSISIEDIKIAGQQPISTSINSKNIQVKFVKNLFTGELEPKLISNKNNKVEIKLDNLDLSDPYNTNPSSLLAMAVGYLGYEGLIVLSSLMLYITIETLPQALEITKVVINNLSEATLSAIKSTVEFGKDCVEVDKAIVQDIINTYNQYVLEKSVNNKLVDVTTIHSIIPGLETFMYANLDYDPYIINNITQCPDILRSYSLGSSLKFTDSDGTEQTLSIVLTEEGKFSLALNGVASNPSQLRVGNYKLPIDVWAMNISLRPTLNIHGTSEAFFVPVVNSKGKIGIYAFADVGRLGKHLFTWFACLELDSVCATTVGALPLPKPKDEQTLNGVNEALKGEGSVVIGGVNTGASGLLDVLGSNPSISDTPGLGEGIVVDSIGSLWDALKDFLSDLVGSIASTLTDLFEGLLSGLQSILEALLAPFIWLGDMVKSIATTITEWFNDFKENTLPNLSIPRVDLFLLYCILITYRIIMLLINFYAFTLNLYMPTTFSSRVPEYIPADVAEAIQFLHGARIRETNVAGYSTFVNSGIDLNVSFIGFVNLIVTFFIVIKIIKIIRGRVDSYNDVYEQNLVDKAKEEQKIVNGLSTKEQKINNLKERSDIFRSKYGHKPGGKK